MNNTRRKQIQVIIDKLVALQEDLERIQDEEQEAFDNIPESLWETERYEMNEEAIENLDTAKDSLDTLLEYLEYAQA